MHAHRGDGYLKTRGLQGAEPEKPSVWLHVDLNVKMQITFTLSVEDFDLLVALVTVHHMVHLTHRSHWQ